MGLQKQYGMTVLAIVALAQKGRLRTGLAPWAPKLLDRLAVSYIQCPRWLDLLLSALRWLSSPCQDMVGWIES